MQRWWFSIGRSCHFPQEACTHLLIFHIQPSISVVSSTWGKLKTIEVKSSTTYIPCVEQLATETVPGSPLMVWASETFGANPDLRASLITSSVSDFHHSPTVYHHNDYNFKWLCWGLINEWRTVAKDLIFLPNITTNSLSGLGKGYGTPRFGKITMAPWRVDLSQLTWACQRSVPLCPVRVKLYTYDCPGRIGHCVMYAGPSAQPVLICLTPCLPRCYSLPLRIQYFA